MRSAGFDSSFTRSLARLAAGSLVVSSALIGVAGLASAASSSGSKVILCHRNDAANKPYVTETVAVDGSDGSLGNGMNDHTSHTGPAFNPGLKAQHIKWGDIIPPYTWAGGSFPGQNWDTAGQNIYNRGCAYAGPDLSMDKVGTLQANPGDSVSYALTVTNAATADATYGDITVTEAPPAELENVTLSAVDAANWNCSGLTCTSSTVVLQPGDSAVFTVTADVVGTVVPPATAHNVASVGTPGDSDSSNDSDYADTHIIAAAVPSVSPFVLSAKCASTPTKVDWTLTNPSSNDTATNLVVTGASASVSPASLAGGHSGGFTSDTLAPGDKVFVTGDVSGQSVESNHVAFSDECEPAAVATSSAPAVSASKACKTGISLVLSNLKGTADAVFTVTKPNGTKQTVTVRAASLVKKSYAVAEDSTATVTVTAANLTKKTVTYKKDCASVLGEKQTRTPRTTESAQLPFTGTPTERMLAVALVLLSSGAFLTAVSRRRRSITG